jgi:hypothetical protein
LDERENYGSGQGKLFFHGHRRLSEQIAEEPKATKVGTFGGQEQRVIEKVKL